MLLIVETAPFGGSVAAVEETLMQDRLPGATTDNGVARWFGRQLIGTHQTGGRMNFIGLDLAWGSRTLTLVIYRTAQESRSSIAVDT